MKAVTRSLRCELQSQAVKHRPGFTLLELMIVIVIIAILIGLLVPAVTSAIKNARAAEVRNDIASLEGAISRFATDYGTAPPSALRLYAAAADWDSAAFAP